MQNSLSLRGISFLFILVLISACRSGNKHGVDIANQLKQSNYDDRVKNIFSYIKDSRFDISNDQCSNIIILQTNLCNSCDKQKLDVILDSLSAVKEPVYFILASDDKEMRAQIEKDRPASTVLIDSVQLLPKYNLSFMRNLRISVCDHTITNWKFL